MKKDSGGKKDSGEEKVRVDAPGRNFYWYLLLIGAVLMVYFTLNLIINVVYGVDLAGKGVNVVLKEAVVENGEVVSDAEVLVLHGVSGWVEKFSPWLALNAYLMALGAIFFAFGYTKVPIREDKAAVSLFKMRLLGGYLTFVALLMVVLGMDRIFFIPHGARQTVLSWIDWYIFEFLAHLIWGVVLAILAVFFFRVKSGDAEDSSE